VHCVGRGVGLWRSVESLSDSLGNSAKALIVGRIERTAGVHDGMVPGFDAQGRPIF
jgi:hypothetical protein